jgi:hypothetical protein
MPRFHNNGVLIETDVFLWGPIKQKWPLSELHFDRTGLIRLIFYQLVMIVQIKTAFVMIGQLN